ncbi:MAG: DUF1194 domain-containing protein, partial [Alphaproteobacteria bacterium]|nr:DUF1194 domain-containing protein [Alphaproteobacteria bacterium]
MRPACGASGRILPGSTSRIRSRWPPRGPTPRGWRSMPGGRWRSTESGGLAIGARPSIVVVMDARHARSLSRRRLGAGMLGLATVAAGQQGLAAGADVELLLVLLNDGSGSIDEEEYRLQREGTASAIEHPQVLRALRGPIAVAYGEWGSPGGAQLILPWTRIAGEDDAGAFADRLVAAPRPPQTWNAIGDALAS